MRSIRLSLALLILFTAATSAYACSCVMGKPCGAITPHDGMFVGTVLSVRESTRELPPIGAQRITVADRVYTLEVVETFKGAQRPGQQVEVETGMGGGDCGYHFNIGQRYFVDGYARDRSLSTGICSLTAPEDEAALTIHELRSALSGGRPPDLSGIILLRNPDGSHISRATAGVAGIPVTITASDGVQFHAVTDSDGLYQITTIPPGDYTAVFQLPPKIMADDFGSKPQKLTVPPGPVPACTLGFNVYPGGRIPGRAVDITGKGVAGFVSAYSMSPVDGRMSLWSAAGFTDTDGRFTLGPLLPGTYWLVFSPAGKEQTEWYYPGTHERDKAQGIVVDDGQASAEVQFVVRQ